MAIALLQTLVMTASSQGIDYPAPHSGSYNLTYPGNYTQQGTPFNPGGGVPYSSFGIDGQDGFVRKTYEGIWSNNGANDNPGLFNGSPVQIEYYDGYLSFGNQNSPYSNYAMEWKGYIQARPAAYYNFLLESDDVAMFWIGTAALDPDNNPPLCSSYNNTSLNANSVLLPGDLCYPIRVRFQEYTGSEKCQLYMSEENGTLVSMNQVFSVSSISNQGYLTP